MSCCGLAVLFMKKSILTVLAVLCLSASVAMAQKRPPQNYIDKGACPGECCTYRKWKAEITTQLFSRPDIHSKRVGIIPAGSSVTALTGDVHTVPSRFLVKKRHGRYRPGDVLWVYTYIGEGNFKVWFNGRMRQEELEFSPFGGTTGIKCEKTAICWGELDRELRSVWWIKIRTPSGLQGWTNQGKNFSGADACA